MDDERAERSAACKGIAFRGAVYQQEALLCHLQSDYGVADDPLYLLVGQ